MTVERIKMKKIIIISFILVLVLGGIVYSHPGRLDSLGGHNNTQLNNYHYHSGQYAGYIVENKGDIPDKNKDIYDFSLVDSGFTDVEDSHWAYEAIKYLKDNNIITGYEDGSFQPNKPITRAEMAYIIYKISK